MSVINKMLRDLDQRQTPAAGAADLLRRDTTSVATPPTVRRRSPALRWATALLPVAAMLAGGLVWWSFQQQLPAAPSVPAPVVQAPSPAPAVAPVVEPVPPAPEPAALASPMPAPVAVSTVPPLPTAPASAKAPLSVGLRMDATLSSPSSALPQATPVTLPAASAVKAAVASASAAVPPTLVAPVAAQIPAKPPLPVAEAVPAGARQQQAGREALAQAQALWASGSRDTAISTLQEAVATAERSNQGGGIANTLVPMVRELARMELAEGRPAAVWDMLLRLEPLLANQPELWALRANAAQRLGRHQDSVFAYTTALQSRPSEQRWLLGAAVSLAALGQTAPAAEMADKARAVGPVSREVLAYLRQQGVPLTDRP
ncbi:hypothetical protein [Rhodoferax sp. TS-BS-61-7]|uniref:hypothetical protein n=1 Tax=Rhodoferax sp. TS-BS-61-7 TaxID=2094194 RepID=UPI001374AAF0|nr:hypothetical protein [Rhodoferax sp. TS-BS-61-7]